MADREITADEAEALQDDPVVVGVAHDELPTDIADEFVEVLARIGVDVEVLVPPAGHPSVFYRIGRGPVEAALHLYAWDTIPHQFDAVTVYVLAEDEEHAWRVFQEQSHSLWWKCWKGTRVGDTDVAIKPRRVESPGVFVMRDEG